MNLFAYACSIAGEGNGTPLQYSCLENPMDRGAWKAAVHGVTRSRTWLNDFAFTFHFHALEKEIATHSSVLAWRTPWTGEPGGLLSLGLHRVGHDWSDLAAAAAAQSLSCVQLTLWDPLHCGPSGSSVHGILQAWILEWVAIPFSRGFSQPRDGTWVFCISGRFLTPETPGKPYCVWGSELFITLRK